MQNIGKTSRKGIYWSFSLKLIQQAYHFGVTIVVARILGPADFGTMAIAMAVIVYANSLTNFGMTSALVQRETINDRLINTVFTFNFSLSILLCLGGVFGAKYIPLFFNAGGIEKILPVLAVIFPLTSFYYIPMALLRRDLRFKAHSIIDLSHNIVQSTTMLIMAICGYGIWSLVFGQIAGISSATILVLIVSRWTPSLKFSIKSIRSVSDYGIWDFLRSTALYLEEYVSYLIISMKMNAFMVGLYDRASAISAMPLNRIQQQISAVIFSAFSRMQTDKKRVTNAFIKAFTATSLLACPLLTGLALVAPHFVLALFGDVWKEMVRPLQILSIAVIFRMLYGVFGNLNIAVCAYRRQSISTIMMTGLYVVFCTIGVRWQLEGLAYAALLASVLTFIYFGYISKNALDLKWADILRCLVPAVTGSIAMSVVVKLAATYMLYDHSVKNLILLVLMGAMTYAGSVLTLRDKKVMNLIKEIFADFKLA
ncbi:MAG: lipopolysaccharide biosynthesis protein [Nitrospirae bacterium]|nr:lipopolysaccharide biosynthesis protein [Nitrospirota bacterium]